MNPCIALFEKPLVKLLFFVVFKFRCVREIEHWEITAKNSFLAKSCWGRRVLIFVWNKPQLTSMKPCYIVFAQDFTFRGYFLRFPRNTLFSIVVCRKSACHKNWINYQGPSASLLLVFEKKEVEVQVVNPCITLFEKPLVKLLFFVVFEIRWVRDIEHWEITAKNLFFESFGWASHFWVSDPFLFFYRRTQTSFLATKTREAIQSSRCLNHLGLRLEAHCA